MDRLKLTEEQKRVLNELKGTFARMKALNMGIVLVVDDGIGIPEIAVFNKTDVRYVDSTEFGAEGNEVSVNELHGTMFMADAILTDSNGELSFTFKDSGQ